MWRRNSGIAVGILIVVLLGFWYFCPRCSKNVDGAENKAVVSADAKDVKKEGEKTPEKTDGKKPEEKAPEKRPKVWPEATIEHPGTKLKHLPLDRGIDASIRTNANWNWWDWMGGGGAKSFSVSEDGATTVKATQQEAVPFQSSEEHKDRVRELKKQIRDAEYLLFVQKRNLALDQSDPGVNALRRKEIAESEDQIRELKDQLNKLEPLSAQPSQPVRSNEPVQKVLPKAIANLVEVRIGYLKEQIQLKTEEGTKKLAAAKYEKQKAAVIKKYRGILDPLKEELQELCPQ